MTSLVESFNPWKHTPLYKNEQNEREIFQLRLLGFRKDTEPLSQIYLILSITKQLQ